MITIKNELCNGCGICVDTCPTRALLLQNGKACIDLSLCEGCEVCIESCPQGALVSQEAVPVESDVIRIPSDPAPVQGVELETRDLRIRDAILTAVGPLLLWTGREILPRLADLILSSLDRRIQPADTALNYETMPYAGQRQAAKGRGRRNRRRRNGKNRRFT